MSAVLAQRYSSAFVDVRATAPDWLAAERADAFARFQTAGFPTRRDELWKYTDVSPITGADLAPTNGERDYTANVDLATLGYGEHDARVLVFIDGRYVPAASHVGSLADGVVIGSVREVLAKTPTLIQAHLDQCVAADHVFAALNTAFFEDGAYIRIPDGVAVEQPIMLYFVASQAAQRLALHPRNLIVMGRHAEAKIVESFHSMTGGGFTNAITEIETHDGAVLEHYKVQQAHNESFHIGGTHLKQHRDSRVESFSIALGGALTRNDLVSRLVGEGAGIVLNGFYMGGTQQHVDNHTLVEHVAPRTESDENYRGVLDGRARAVFNGKVIVHPNAQEIAAAQANANLLLSDDAEIDTKPELEIYADNVKCSHGASVGQLDKDALFYLRSRCMDEETSRNLLTFAFADEVIRRIKFAPVRQRLENIIGGRLPCADLIKANLSSVL